MQALKEVGMVKAIKFLLFSWIYIIYRIQNMPFARMFILSLFGAKIGSKSIIMEVSFFNWHQKGFSGLKVGRECFIGDQTLMDLYDLVILEDQVTLAQRVTVLTHLNVGYTSHPLQKYFPRMSSPVTFKSGSVVCASSTILPGITIGKNSMVAAGSVVTKDVPENTLVAGVPAKIVRRLE